MRNIFSLLILLAFPVLLISAKEQKVEKSESKLNSGLFSSLKFRNLGPAIASGRIGDIAVNPNNPDEWIIAVSSGNVWKTTNHGITFKPVFDSYGSYSIGCVSYDPSNPHTVWLGSGENNSQRSVSFGDGVYRSTDGGESWENVGLKNSEHIGKIIIDPRNSNTVWVAAQGPLWKSGGDRGLYKTTDFGKTWEQVLKISDNTGVTDIVMDPRNSDVVYAATYQRRRHVWTLINGGPEGSLQKTTDGGKSWVKLSSGLPSGDIGRIGLAISPANPDCVYAIVEALNGSGFYRSTNRGASWEFRNSNVAGSPQYYQEIFCDPKNPDKVISMDTYSKYSLDGGKTWTNLGLSERHVDHHAFWFDPNNSEHIIIGGDGGLYESYDFGKNWDYFENLPITQFYRVTADNSEPFYNIYGGTQDNNTLGGPSRTRSSGIYNEDWFYTVGGDGFETVIDPSDPNIVYSQPQYGMLVRYDKKSGEMTVIQPQEDAGEEHRWNWNSPVIISPFDHKTLYFAANKLFKSTDRGNSWVKVSGDLTRQIDRNQLKVMGKLWSPETIAKNASTSLYGNIVSLEESTKKKGLLYVGTDDGLIQVSENDGGNWTSYSKFTSVPDTSYVSDICADLFDEDVVYATFDNKKRGDFKPYILKSNDKGKSWKLITKGIAENAICYSLVQDHINPNLLFVGTEFGIYTSIDAGENWIKLTSGLPTIAIYDLDIQRRESDLVAASFGRGFYILDDYTPLRTINEDLTNKEAHIFPIKDALMYVEDESRGRRSMGANFYRAENPTFGATFTYYIKEAPKSLKSLRKDKEKEAEKAGKDITYPTLAELEKEDIQPSASLIFTIKDKSGNVVKRLTAPYSQGMNRINWDLRYADLSPVSNNTDVNKISSYPAAPGVYTVTLSKLVDGVISDITEPTSFTCKLLGGTSLPAKDLSQLEAFQKEAFDFRRTVETANSFISNSQENIDQLSKIVLITNATDNSNFNELSQLKSMIYEVRKSLRGNPSIAKRNENQSPDINERLMDVLWSFWQSTSEPTQTSRKNLNIAKDEFDKIYPKMQELERRIMTLSNKLSQSNSPYLQGELPIWKR